MYLSRTGLSRSYRKKSGTFRGALALSRRAAETGYQLQVAGIPATIDNDIGCSHYTIGFDTACNTAVECIDRLRDTMQSHERCSVVEVMGRHAGYLALYVGISVGATAVLIPERELDFERDVVEKIRRAPLLMMWLTLDVSMRTKSLLISPFQPRRMPTQSIPRLRAARTCGYEP